MAKDKTSFVLYTDQRTLIDLLTDEQAGKLLKHIFSYVNDENPICNDQLINIAFEPIKQQFKRDLVKWEKTKEGRSKAGLASSEARKLNKIQQNSTNVNNVQQSSTNLTVNDNVNVNVNVINKDTNVSTHPLCLWIKENCLNVSKLKNQLTSKQAEKLIEDYTRESIKEVLEAMENYKELTKKYVSVNSTLRNWIKKRQENNPNYGILKTLEATLTKEEALLKKYEGIDIHQVPLDDRLPVHNLRQQYGR